MQATSSVSKAFHPHHFPWVKTKPLTLWLYSPPGEVISLSLEILQYFVSTTYCFKLYSLIFLIKKQTLGEKIYALCIIMSLRKPNALPGI